MYRFLAHQMAGLVLLAAGFTAGAGAKLDFESVETGVNGRIRNFGRGGAPEVRAVIVETGEPFYGKVLRISPAQRPPNNYFRFYSGTPERVAVDFDLRIAGNQPVLTWALMPHRDKLADFHPDIALVWLMADAKEGVLKCFSGGGWQTIGPLNVGQWHHIRVVARLAGEAASTCDISIDGGDPKGSQIPFRNPLQHNERPRMGAVLLAGRPTAAADGCHADVDNLTVTWFPARSAAGSMPPATPVSPDNPAADRIVTGRFDSKALGKSQPYTVVLPEDYAADKGPYPVVFLLHGRGRHNSSLTDNPKTRAALFRARFITVMPRGDDNWYIDSPVKPQSRYNSFLEELVGHINQTYPVETRREKRGITGWSMGGYGCTRFAESHPEDFGALAPMIGLLDYPRTGLPEKQSYAVATGIFGSDETLWREFNPINHIEALRGMKVLIVTGSNAFDRTMNQNFSRALNEQGIEHKMIVIPGGSHSFATVGQALDLVVDFMNQSIAK